MIQSAPAGLLLLALVAAGQSGGALVSQRLDGLRRVCSYEDRVRGRRAPRFEITVGMAEPCPFQYPRRQPRRAEIPAMATLEAEVRERGQTTCRYVYLGVRYNRPIRVGGYCPYTPNFAD
ncbi:MAG TPA: hypothetical protein VGW40_05700 [Allosphingosinicella sp.]|nr:hypothetical protein [Allosphingosinicella sp.]